MNMPGRSRKNPKKPDCSSTPSWSKKQMPTISVVRAYLTTMDAGRSGRSRRRFSISFNPQF
jgi:hypothetical protein